MPFFGILTLVSEIRDVSVVFGAGCTSDMPTDCAQFCLFIHTYGAGRTLLARTGTNHRGQLHMCVHVRMHVYFCVCSLMCVRVVSRVKKDVSWG